jgi:hypothetical protein
VPVIAYYGVHASSKNTDIVRIPRHQPKSIPGFYKVSTSLTLIGNSSTRAAFLPRVDRYTCFYCCYCMTCSRCSSDVRTSQLASLPIFTRLIMCFPARMRHIPLTRCIRRILAQCLQRLGEWMSSTHTQAIWTDRATLRSLLVSIGHHRRLCSATVHPTG